MWIDISKNLKSFKLESSEWINEVFANFRFRLVYKPYLIPVAAALVVVIALTPLLKRRRSLENEFEILQIEMELSLESLEGSIFDLYGDGASLFDDTSRRRPPATLS